MQTKNTVLYAAQGTCEQYLRWRITEHSETADEDGLSRMDIQDNDMGSAETNVSPTILLCMYMHLRW